MTKYISEYAIDTFRLKMLTLWYFWDNESDFDSNWYYISLKKISFDFLTDDSFLIEYMKCES